MGVKLKCLLALGAPQHEHRSHGAAGVGGNVGCRAWTLSCGREKRGVVSHNLRKSVNRRREEKLGTEKGVCIRTSNNVILFISDVQSTLNGVIRTHTHRGWREREREKTQTGSAAVPYCSAQVRARPSRGPRPSLSACTPSPEKRKKEARSARA